MEYKIGEVFKHKGSYILVTEGNTCTNCFFDLENYPYVDLTTKSKTCYRKNFYCGASSRSDNKDVYYKEIFEIEYLILKGGKND